MITINIIQRVFHIRVGASTGTAFAIEQDDRQYLITAAHVVSSLKGSYVVELFHEGAWKTLALSLTGISQNADIAVFAPPFQLAPSLPTPVSADGVTYGQDVYFLGFPYGIAPEFEGLNRAFPFPLVKKACLSAFTKENGASVAFLDGYNNPGFSGGPVIFQPAGDNSNSRFRIMGVISGYRFANEPVYNGDLATPVSIRANTGIIISYDIRHAVDEINRNPNGAKIKAD